MTETTTAPTAPTTTAQALGSDVALGDLPIGVQHFIKAGCHFGHQTKRWNPKMRPFIYGARNGIHIIDLDQTATLFKRAYNFVVEAVGRGGHVLFVGTKRQAQDIVQEEALRANQFFVNDRWLGGTLTNFRTIKTGIERLRTLERMNEDGTMDGLPKKEALMLNREREKLEKFLGGIKAMNGVPSVIFVIDPHHEHIAIREGRKLNIPIVAITDTNCDPDLVDFVIPANDDAIRSVKLITSRLADAAIEGNQRRREFRSEGGQSNAPREGRGEGVSVEFSRGNRRGGQGGRPGGGGGGGGRGPRRDGGGGGGGGGQSSAPVETTSEAPESTEGGGESN
ncbi:MAG TPA: 30S ribosomal protein S2 [Polyangiales bacterium]|nr:30S ribosomal protein S2 [Polyangiales bacterium]